MAYYFVDRDNTKDIYFNLENFNFIKTTDNIEDNVFNNSTKYEMKFPDRLTKAILLSTNTCNLACPYCIAGGGTYTLNNGKIMASLDDCKGSILEIYRAYKEGIEYVQFFGGEPLCNMDFLKDAVDFINSLCDEMNVKKPIYSIVTNGTLLDEEVALYFKSIGMVVTISLDGNEAIHNKTRKTKEGHDTYRRIFENIDRMQGVRKIVELSVTDSFCLDYKPGMMSKLVEELAIHDISGIVFNLIFTDEINLLFLDRESNFLNISEEYIDTMIEKLFQSDCDIFDFALTNTIIAVLTKSKMRNTCTAGIGNLTINTNGDILKCYLSEDESYLEKTDFRKDREKSHFIDLPFQCGSCEIFGLCSGWCSEINNGKIVESKCIYTKLLVNKALNKIHKNIGNKDAMTALINNIKSFQKFK